MKYLYWWLFHFAHHIGLVSFGVVCLGNDLGNFSLVFCFGMESKAWKLFLFLCLFLPMVLNREIGIKVLVYECLKLAFIWCMCIWILLCLLECNYGMWKFWFSKLEIVMAESVFGTDRKLCDWTECCFSGHKILGCYEADSCDLMQEQILLRLYLLNAND